MPQTIDGFFALSKGSLAQKDLELICEAPYFKKLKIRQLKRVSTLLFSGVFGGLAIT